MLNSCRLSQTGCNDIFVFFWTEIDFFIQLATRTEQVWYGRTSCVHLAGDCQFVFSWLPRLLVVITSLSEFISVTGSSLLAELTIAFSSHGTEVLFHSLSGGGLTILLRLTISSKSQFFLVWQKCNILTDRSMSFIVIRPLPSLGQYWLKFEPLSFCFGRAAKNSDYRCWLLRPFLELQRWEPLN